MKRRIDLGLAPRENIDYTKYYQIRIIPTDDKEDVNPTHPIFDNLFEVYALTFREFLDYLQVFNNTRVWNDYTPDDHRRTQMCIYTAIKH